MKPSGYAQQRLPSGMSSAAAVLGGLAPPPPPPASYGQTGHRNDPQERFSSSATASSITSSKAKRAISSSSSSSSSVPPISGKRLRIHKTNPKVEYALCRFPTVASDNKPTEPPSTTSTATSSGDGFFCGLKLPISIQRDIPKSSDVSLISSAPLRLLDSSRRGGTGGGQRNFSSVAARDSMTYFVLIEGQSDEDVVDVLPLSSWHTFAVDTSKARITEEEAERHKRLAAEKEMHLNAQIHQRAHADSDDEKTSEGATKTYTVFSEDLGIAKQKTKQQKLIRQLAGERAGQERQGAGADGNSALTLGSLRNATDTWDFDKDLDNTDDEVDEDAAGEDAMYDPTAPEAEEGDEAGPADGAALTSYGETMRTLLKSQQENDEEDELAQYSDDNDEDAEKQSGSDVSSSAAPTSSSSSSTSSSSSSFFLLTPAAEPPPPSQEEEAVPASPPPQEPSSAAGGSTSSQSKTEVWEGRVIRKMQQNGGRMNIREFMDTFKLKTKDADFRLLQQVVKRLCTAQSDTGGSKNKYIQLKPEYRR
eukprot:GHVS01077282.1.p1 GENE.GHVS01077282.1~~GHVS01077282.1.p1  ORF type:complete len:535 (+),score=151.86 GHVS01077282.1:461-2065(+)